MNVDIWNENVTWSEFNSEWFRVLIFFPLLILYVLSQIINPISQMIWRNKDVKKGKPSQERWAWENSKKSKNRKLTSHDQYKEEYTFSYLALGDCYTIGEKVQSSDIFPMKLALLLRQSGIAVSDPFILAKTGWKTNDLSNAIQQQFEINRPHDNINKKFSFVTLLIGANNQYNGHSIESYQEEFYGLLNLAVGFTRNPQLVFVLSIPDWGATPFAQGMNRSKISIEINNYNSVNRAIALSHNCHYFDVTESTRKHMDDPRYIAFDGLHPSKLEYAHWAEKLSILIRGSLSLSVRDKARKRTEIEFWFRGEIKITIKKIEISLNFLGWL